MATPYNYSFAKSNFWSF